MTENFFSNTIQKLADDFLNFLPDLVISVIIVLVFYFFAKRLSSGLKKRLLNRTSDPLLSSFIGKISKWFLVFLGIMIGMKAMGLTMLAGGLITGAGISAVILGFAFKNIGENFLAGLLLAFNRPFKVGDLIVTSGFTGRITSMDFRYTNIKTAEGQDVFIPNSLIITSPLINFTRDGVRRFDFSIQLDYNTDIDSAKEILMNTIKVIKEVLQEPHPIVTIDQLTSNVILKIYYWINSNEAERTILEVKSDAIEKCKKNLTEGGIVFSDVTLLRITNEVFPVDMQNEEQKPGGKESSKKNDT